MLFEVIKNKWGFIVFGLAGFAVLQTLSIHALVVPLPFFILLLDTFIYCILYFVIAVPLLNVIRFGNMNVLQLPVRIVNYVALGVVVLGITIGMGYSIEFLFFDETYRSVFYALIPLRIFSSVLVYLLILLLCLKYKKEQENNDEEINGRNRETENKQNEPENNRKETENVRNESDNSRNESENTSVIERIAVKSGTKIHVVPIAEVLCLVADGDYVQVVTEKGKFLKEQTMKYFETQLPQNQFIRVHRSCIVNVEAISRIELYEKQSQQLMLKNGDKIKLSQAGYKLLREKLRL